jgi:hypothetical protein
MGTTNVFRENCMPGCADIAAGRANSVHADGKIVA